MTDSRPVSNSSASWPKSYTSNTSSSTWESAGQYARRLSHASSYTSADLLRSRKDHAPSSYLCDEDLLSEDPDILAESCSSISTASDDCVVPGYHHKFDGPDEYRQRKALQQERRREAMLAMKSSRKNSDADQRKKAKV